MVTHLYLDKIFKIKYHSLIRDVKHYPDYKALTGFKQFEAIINISKFIIVYLLVQLIQFMHSCLIYSFVLAHIALFIHAHIPYSFITVFVHSCLYSFISICIHFSLFVHSHLYCFVLKNSFTHDFTHSCKYLCIHSCLYS